VVGKTRKTFSLVMLMLCSKLSMRQAERSSSMATIGVWFNNPRQSIQTIAAHSWYPTLFQTALYV
jgi:hypothetical protein